MWGGGAGGKQSVKEGQRDRINFTIFYEFMGALTIGACPRLFLNTQAPGNTIPRNKPLIMLA